MNQVIIIAGPTAVGKTELALNFAQQHNGEIVSSDSMQIYRYMDIGSAKPSKEELAQVPHHLIDILNPDESFTVSDYQIRAKEVFRDILGRGKVPVLSGGTGLYINALLYDMDFSSQPPNLEYRKSLEEYVELKGSDALYERLVLADSEAAKAIHPNNIKRVIRALEIAELGGVNKGDFNKDLQQNSEFSFKLLCLMRPRWELYDRINRRVDLMMNNGLLDEVIRLKEMGYNKSLQSMQGIGYKELLDYLDGTYRLEEAVDLIKKNSRHYAKRQMTWFKRYSEACWIDLERYQDTASALSAINTIIIS